jgi:hypothetical protein
VFLRDQLQEKAVKMAILTLKEIRRKTRISLWPLMQLLVTRLCLLSLNYLTKSRRVSTHLPSRNSTPLRFSRDSTREVVRRTKKVLVLWNRTSQLTQLLCDLINHIKHPCDP